MKLVVSWQDTDDCTYSCDVHQPVEYESAEALAVHLEEFCKDFIVRRKAHLESSPYRNGRHFWPGDSPEWKAWVKACGEFDSNPQFAGVGLYADCFIQDGKYVAPDIRALDGWWEACK